MTPAKTVQHWTLIAIGVFTMLSAVMLAMAPDLIGAVKCCGYLLGGVIALHMLTRPEQARPLSPAALRIVLLREHPELGEVPGWADLIASTVARYHAKDRP